MSDFGFDPYAEDPYAAMYGMQLPQVGTDEAKRDPLSRIKSAQAYLAALQKMVGVDMFGAAEPVAPPQLESDILRISADPTIASLYDDVELALQGGTWDDGTPASIPALIQTIQQSTVFDNPNDPTDQTLRQYAIDQVTKYAEAKGRDQAAMAEYESTVQNTDPNGMMVSPDAQAFIDSGAAKRSSDDLYARINDPVLPPGVTSDKMAQDDYVRRTATDAKYIQWAKDQGIIGTRDAEGWGASGGGVNANDLREVLGDSKLRAQFDEYVRRGQPEKRAGGVTGKVGVPQVRGTTRTSSGTTGIMAAPRFSKEVSQVRKGSDYLAQSANEAVARQSTVRAPGNRAAIQKIMAYRTLMGMKPLPE